jgi:hypothetical protein
MKEKISFGKELNYLFKYIDIDEKWGTPIFIENEVVGGVLVSSMEVLLAEKYDCPFFSETLLHGIEIEPKWRRKGIAKEVIKRVVEKSDVVVGSITDKDALPFWKSVGGVVVDTTELVKKNIPNIMNMRGVTDMVASVYIIREGVDDRVKKHLEKSFNVGIKI